MIVLLTAPMPGKPKGTNHANPNGSIFIIHDHDLD
jgi:hypothetical protein